MITPYPSSLNPIVEKVPEVYVYVIGFFSSVVTMLLLVVAFFLKNLMSEFKDMKNAWIELTGKFISLSANSINQINSCVKAHNGIDLTLKDHSEKLQEHGEAIAVLKRRRNYSSKINES